MEVAPLTEVMPFIKMAPLTTVTLLTEVTPLTDVMHLGDDAFFRQYMLAMPLPKLSLFVDCTRIL